MPYLNIYSIERTRQPKHQVRHLNQKNTQTKTTSTPSQSKDYANQNTKYAISIKRIRKPKQRVRHLNQKSTPTKTPSTPSQSKECANQTPSGPSQSKEYAYMNFSHQYRFTLFCRAAIIVANLLTFQRTI